VTTKVFVDRDQEVKWEANGKTKIDFLQQPLLNSQADPSELIQAEAEAIPENDNKCPRMPPL
jgi:hypothetical protein